MESRARDILIRILCNRCLCDLCFYFLNFLIDMNEKIGHHNGGKPFWVRIDITLPCYP